MPERNGVAEPRPAAVMLLRPARGGADRGMEVLLMRRVRSMGFAPGAHVLPGGREDECDAGGVVRHHPVR